ncbi:hypothetical protein CGLAMM_09850 [Acetobacteraceae bacterium EV16G]|uniref:Uncharacterized protein n=1 Tax=Sorlinia euscelidii TaxID=3081148 RepID=A0ABU7U5F2_9PROT
MRRHPLIELQRAKSENPHTGQPAKKPTRTTSIKAVRGPPMRSVKIVSHLQQLT